MSATSPYCVPAPISEMNTPHLMNIFSSATIKIRSHFTTPGKCVNVFAIIIFIHASPANHTLSFPKFLVFRCWSNALHISEICSCSQLLAVISHHCSQGCLIVSSATYGAHISAPCSSCISNVGWMWRTFIFFFDWTGIQFIGHCGISLISVLLISGATVLVVCCAVSFVCCGALWVSCSWVSTALCSTSQMCGKTICSAARIAFLQAAISFWCSFWGTGKTRSGVISDLPHTIIKQK